MCLECQTASESSSRFDHFYELGVPVRGFKSLDESLTSLLSPEILDGPNQFSCERCGGKRDATRRLRVRSLPPLFCLSLQRFVYDVVKGNRVKATDKFAFPLELKAAAVMGGGDAEGEGADAVYDLEAILIHKGGSATHGHYGMFFWCVLVFFLASLSFFFFFFLLLQLLISSWILLLMAVVAPGGVSMMKTCQKWKMVL